MTIGYKWVVTLNKLSGIANDRVENTFYTNTVADHTVVLPALNSFYTNLGSYFAPSMNGTGTVNQYVIPDTRPLPGIGLGPPIWTGTLAGFAVPGTVGLPAEVAVAISYHADFTNVPEHGPGKTRPRATRRGRLYIGELQYQTMATLTTGGKDTVIDPGTVTALSQVASNLLHVSGLGWSVFSQKNWALYPVVGGWVDNSWDSARRRKVAPSVRNSWS